MEKIVHLDVKHFVTEVDRIKEGLSNRNLTAEDVINIESIANDTNTDPDPVVRVWYRFSSLKTKSKENG